MMIESVGDLVREFGTSSDDRKVALISKSSLQQWENRKGYRPKLWQCKFQQSS